MFVGTYTYIYYYKARHIMLFFRWGIFSQNADDSSCPYACLALKGGLAIPDEKQGTAWEQATEKHWTSVGEGPEVGKPLASRGQTLGTPGETMGTPWETTRQPMEQMGKHANTMQTPLESPESSSKTPLYIPSKSCVTTRPHASKPRTRLLQEDVQDRMCIPLENNTR